MKLFKRGKFAFLILLLFSVLLLFPAIRADAVACGDGQSHRYNGTDGCSVCGAPLVAYIGDAYYNTLAEAMAAARQDDTVTLLCATLDEDITVADGVTLDGNGCALYGTVINYGLLCNTHLFGGLENHGIVLSAHLCSAVTNHAGGVILNTAVGDITIGNGFSVTSTGAIDCRHHFGGTAGCSAYALCRLCGAAYGDTLPHNDADEDGLCDNCDHVFPPPQTTTAIPIITAAPTTTTAPITTTVPTTTAPTAPPTVTTTVTTTVATTTKAPPATEKPITALTPTTTRAPATTKAPSTAKAPASTQATTASGTTAITTKAEDPSQSTSVASKLSWWHYGIIGLLIGAIAAFSLRRMD